MKAAFFPMKQLLNDTFMEEWLSNELKTIKSLFADGINLDPEAPIAKDSKEAAALTKWTKAAVDLFHHEIPGSQVTSSVLLLMYYVQFYNRAKIAGNECP